MQVELFDPDLGVLELGCDPYVVTQLQIGSPEVRDVMRNRSLANGAIDRSRYMGARAITVALRLRNHGACVDAPSDMQQLYDRIVPYMNPARRPTLSWQLPGSGEVRAMVVRGEQWPFTVEHPRYPTLALQWVCPSGEIFAGDPDGGGGLDEQCVVIKPGAVAELGRTYDETYVDGGRGPYPAQDPIGSRTVINPGTAPAHWHLTIFGAVTNPNVTINGVVLSFNNNGGLVVPAGQSVVVDSREHTVLMNGTPGDSRYDRINYTDWSWDDLMLQPGENDVRFDGTALGPNAAAQMCFTPTYLG